MSKSLGNGIDPLEVIDKYGADALRMTLITGNAPGNDMRFYWERVEASRNFANKVWNASRFIMMNMKDTHMAPVDLELSPMRTSGSCPRATAWQRKLPPIMDKYELGIAVQKIYDFIWEEFCDWYIEMVKPRLYNQEDTSRDAALWTLTHRAHSGIEAAAPVHAVYHRGNLLHHPGGRGVHHDLRLAEVYAGLGFPGGGEMPSRPSRRPFVPSVTCAHQMNVPPSRKAAVYVVSDDEEIRKIFREW